MKSVLFVCLGNICRSPIAEGVFRELLTERGWSEQVRVDSAGTSGFHQGEPPDRRSIHVCSTHGLHIGGQRSRRVVGSDFTNFDLIVAMDRSNEADLRAMAGSECTAQIVRLLEYGGSELEDVPDPYYGGDGGFQHVFDLVSDAMKALLDSHDWRR